MTSYTLSPVWGAGAQLFDNSGNVLTGGKIYTYEAGTTTPAVTYTTPTGSAFNSNPIIADASGRLSNEIWFPVSGAYKFVLKDTNDVLIATYDNIPTIAQPPIVNDASSISYEQGYIVTAGAFTVGANYLITSVGTTNFVAIGATANVVGILFTATGVGSGNGTAEYSRTVQSKLQESVSVKDFGAVGDGIVDDTVAIQNAFATVGKSVYIPKGTYLVSSTLTPLCSEIFGEGEYNTVIKANTSVAKVISITTYGPHVLKDFQIDGTATTNATGIIFGDATSWASGNVQNLRVYGFQGGSGVGVRIDQALESVFIKLYCTVNSINMLVEQQSVITSNPTTLHFDSCTFQTSQSWGVAMYDGFGIVYTNCVFEGSTLSGLYISASKGRSVLETYIGTGCWFESNYANDPLEYHVQVGNNLGTGPGAYLRPIFDNVHFSTNSSGATPKAILLDGAEVQGYSLRNIRLTSSGSTSGAVTAQNNATGTVDSWPSYLTYNYDFISSANSDSGVYGNWVTYTPTIISDLSAVTSYTYASTQIINCKRKWIGKTLFIDFHINCVLNAVTPTNLMFTLPQLAYSPVTLTHTSYNYCQLYINGTAQAGHIFGYQPDSYIYVNKVDDSVYPASAAVSLRGQIQLELT